MNVLLWRVEDGVGEQCRLESTQEFYLGMKAGVGKENGWFVGTRSLYYHFTSQTIMMTLPTYQPVCVAVQCHTDKGLLPIHPRSGCALKPHFFLEYQIESKIQREREGNPHDGSRIETQDPQHAASRLPRSQESREPG